MQNSPPSRELTRHLAVVVYGDIVGFTSRIATGDHQTVIDVARLRGCVENTTHENRGRLVDFVGDSLLIELSSMRDALRCALALQRACSGNARDLGCSSKGDIRFSLRLGIHLGDLIVDGDRIYGDAFLAEFETATRAVECALDIQDAS